MSALSNSNWSRRSLLRTATGLAAAGTPAACGSNDGRGGGSAGGGLVQYFHAYGEAGTEQAIKKYAAAYDGAEVTTRWITGSNFESKLFASLLTDDAPDLFEFHPQIQLVKSGQVANLTDLVEPVRDDFNQADIRSHTVDGKVYGVRMIDDPQFFFYRRSLLEKAGVGVPQTLDELIAAAAELTTDKVKGVYLGNTLQAVIRPMIWAAGADTLDDRNRPACHTDGVVEGLGKLVVGVLHTAVTLLVCSLAGYGLARIPYRHAAKVFYAVLFTLMVPTAVTFVPGFVLVSSLGWIDSYRGLIVPGLFSGFTCFLFRQYFLGFPKELEEAARVDGLNHWGAYWRVVVPNSLNFFAAIATITFINGWNSFLWPLVIGQDPSAWTVQVALSSYMTNQTVNYHLIFMATALSLLPLLLVFLFLQRWLVQGIARTGIKG
ncbi:extracellular solute-binding protein [Streptomyces sp. NPDC059894]|uniref:extracellular solute-binding protein n=1 Tax=unclassified Streptomyces TaxID=2593676 RepID=UPI00365F3D20